MYIEITEHKADSILEHMEKGIKCFYKAMECLEEAKSSRYNREDDYEDDNFEEDERHGSHGKRRKHMRYGGSSKGRYME